MKISFSRTVAAGAVVLLAACSEPTSVQEPLKSPAQIPTDNLIAPQFSAGAVVGLTPTTSVGSPVATCSGSTTFVLTLDAISPPPSTVPVDIVLVLDESGSLNSTEFAQIKTASITFVQNMDAADGANDGTLSGGRVAVVMFGSNARLVIGLSSNEATLVNTINAISQIGGLTNMDAGLLAAHGILPGGITNDVVLLMTDGVFSGTNPSARATAMKNSGIEIYSIGMGDNINVAALQALSSGAGHYFQAPTGAELTAIFTEIATGVAGPAATNITYNAAIAAGWTLTGAEVTPAGKGTLTSSPTSIQWSVSELRTEQVIIRYTLQHTSAVGGTQAIHSSAALTFTQPPAAPSTSDYSGVTTQVNGCNTAPTANAGPDQSVDLSGSPNVNVTLDGSASTDDGQIAALTFAWTEGATSLGAGVSPTVSLGLGAHTITLTVSDGEYTRTAEVVITVSDPSPPVITKTVTGTPGNNGWYTSNIGVHFDVVDLESPATTTGCGDQSVTADTPAASFTCSASSAGGSSSSTASVKRDATNPVVTFTGALSYAVDQTVSITCSSSDNLSGIASDTCASISGPAYSFGLGAHTFGASATDNAGNTTSTSGAFTVGVTAQSLCALVQAWASNAGVANSLCVKLAHGSYGAWVNEVQAQSGKKISAGHAAILIQLVAGLQN
jgi:uncharacterized protein YegL